MKTAEERLRHAAYQRKYVAAHPRSTESRRAGYPRRNEWRRLRRQKALSLRRAFIDAARAGGCVDCGNKNLNVLHSDHVRGTKVGNVSEMMNQLVPLSRLFAELDKCETRCANCHMLVSRERERTKKAA